jgi:hypothetical protein
MKSLLLIISIATIIVVANFKESIPYYDKIFGGAMIVGLFSLMGFSKYSPYQTCYNCNEKVSSLAKKCKHCHSKL